MREGGTDQAQKAQRCGDVRLGLEARWEEPELNLLLSDFS